jgi:hypothetical protein
MFMYLGLLEHTKNSLHVWIKKYEYENSDFWGKHEYLNMKHESHPYSIKGKTSVRSSLLLGLNVTLFSHK